MHSTCRLTVHGTSQLFQLYSLLIASGDKEQGGALNSIVQNGHLQQKGELCMSKRIPICSIPHTSPHCRLSAALRRTAAGSRKMKREWVGGSEAPPGRQCVCGFSFFRFALLNSLNFCAFAAGPSRNGSRVAQLSCRGTLGRFFAFNALVPVAIRLIRQFRS